IHIIESARSLNVAIKIITSDTKEVSAFIAQRTGLIAKYDEVITSDLVDFNDPNKLLEQVTSHSVFAQCNEEQRYKIIECLQSKYFTAYIGDGINDSTSLALANVSIALDSSSNIAKQDSEIVLLTNGLEVV